MMERGAGDGVGGLVLVRLIAEVHHATVGVRPNLSSSSSVLPIRHIIGVGRNYAAHAEEQGASAPERPMLFTKNPAAAALDGDAIRIPACCRDREQVDYEGELAVVIGRACKDVSEEDVLDEERSPVLGFCVANDVSARWWQKEGSGGQFNRGKSFDGFCPLGPVLTPLGGVGELGELTIETRLNGEVVQRSSTGRMIFSVPRLVAECTRDTTLVPGTVILTGTPSGVGMAQDPPRYLRAGDEVSVSVSGFGTLRNVVSG